MKNYYSLKRLDPMVVFWLGVLAGAVIMGLIAYYKVLLPQQYQGAFYKYNDAENYKKTYDTYNLYDSYGTSSDIMVAPDPTGGKTIYQAPDPTGG